MNLHEYQGKQLFASYGIKVPKGATVAEATEAAEAARKIGSDKWVVKAQVHAGGRGKAGGVKLVDSLAEVEEFAQEKLGTRLVTKQTDKDGQPINSILIENCTNIKQELYLGGLIDRAQQRVVFMASAAGGMDIEEVADKEPHKIHKITIDPIVGPLPFQGRYLAFKLGLQGKQIKQFVDIFIKLAKLFQDKDLSMIEVNPLVITSEDDLLCLDAKINVDANALYRQPELVEMRDESQEDERENEAAEHNLSYVSLDGNIGCMVNGAGLAMATMDIIKSNGGEPANFLDVGGGATKERVSAAFKIILASAGIKAVLINIFGGIVRCDLIAEGIVAALQDVGVSIPVVVRLEGNNAEKGMQILDESPLDVIAVKGLQNAAAAVVKGAAGAK